MRSLKYAILGLLEAGPLTHEDLKEKIQNEIIHVWSIKNSQLNPELKKLMKENFISKENNEYQLTDSGHNDFIKWLHQDDAIHHHERNPFSLRILFSQEMDQERLRQLLISQKVQHIAKMNYYLMLINQEKRTSNNQKMILIYRRIYLKEEATIKWLDECLEYYQGIS